MRAFDRLKKPTRRERAPLLPMLRKDSWPMVWQCAHRSLLPGRRGPGIPFIGLARQRGDGFDFLLKDGLGTLGLTYPEAEAYALSNLARRPYKWHVLHKDEHTEQPLLMGMRGGPHTASYVLEPQAIAEVQAQLNTSMLLVSVPSLREVYVTDASPAADHVLFDAFEAWAKRHFDRAEPEDQLSTRAFLMRNGVVEGIFKQPDA